MGLSLPCCATCCAFLSGGGVVFLLILGALMQRKSRTIELSDSVMEEHYMAPYICAGVYFVFLVVSCLYLHIHEKRRKAAPPPNIFVLGSFADGDADPASRDTITRSGSSKSLRKARSRASAEVENSAVPAEQELTPQTPKDAEPAQTQSEESRWGKSGDL